MLIEAPTGQVENEKQFGVFKISVNIAGKIIEGVVPAIESGGNGWGKFEEEAVKFDIPVYAYRYGSRGQCHIGINHNALGVTEIKKFGVYSFGLDKRDEYLNTETGSTFIDSGVYRLGKDHPTESITIKGRLSDGQEYTGKIYYSPPERN